jgi:hypothetical protein
MKYKNNKTMKTQSQFKTLTLTILFVLLSGIVFSQNFETTKSLNKNATVSENVTINMSNYSGDLKIITSNANTVKIETSVKISGKSKEDVEKILRAVENFEFEANKDELKIDTRFYKNMQSVNNRRTVTLLNGDKVRIKEFEITHELQIPTTANLVLSNKYSDIELEELKGSVNLTLYSSKLHSENISNNVEIEAKYSKIYLKEITGDLELNLYDSDLEFISSGNVSVKSKYSKISAKKVGNLTLDSYDDKFYIDEMNGLTLTAKYSDLESAAEVDQLKLELYDCNVKIKSAKSGTFTGKYSDLKLGNVKELKISNSYDNDLYFGKTMNIRIDESKYSKYEFGEVAEFSLVGHDDQVSISELNSEFSGLSMNGKYCKLEANAGSVPFQVAFKIKYAKVDLPESVNIIKHIEKNGDLEMIGNKTGGLISVEGYDMKVLIR